MKQVVEAFAAALRDLREPRILTLVLVPPLAALAVWGALAWAFADDWARWVSDWLSATSWLNWIGDLGLSSLFVWTSGIVAFVLLLPVMLITAVLVTEIVAMPVIVPWVGEHDFRGLERRAGGTVIGSVVNAAKAVVLFAVMWVVTLPLWLTGIGALLLPPLLSAHFNQRVFRYDALAEHASPEEYARIVAGAGGRLFALGLLLSACYYVPVVNVVVPVLSAVAFTHLCLAELARLRQKGVTSDR